MNKANLSFENKKDILCKLCNTKYTQSEFEGLEQNETLIYCEGCESFISYYNFKKVNNPQPETIPLEKS